MIGFNKPYLTGKEFDYIREALKIEKLSGNGYFTKSCHYFFERNYGFRKALLTHSATAALEMAAILIDIQPGDEVIVPSYTFVSTANAFLLRGASIVFADSCKTNPNLDADLLPQLITPKTKAIVVVHYAGVACEMDKIMSLARKNNIFVIEDAAQSIDSYYKSETPLGSIGHLAAFSFHETKNIISGEGGMLVVNDDRFVDRAEIIWEKGTNRAAFSRHEINKYTWVDIGSSFLPSEVTAAFLLAQLERLDEIQKQRKIIWQRYFDQLKPLEHTGRLRLPDVPSWGTNNAHMFYVVAENLSERDGLLSFLHTHGIQAIFHYVPLHSSPFARKINRNTVSLPNADFFGDTLIRLPFFYELTPGKQMTVTDRITQFFTNYPAGGLSGQERNGDLI
jgi:dTDP-4-amino-4,6-dideoxygalactose transaminase